MGFLMPKMPSLPAVQPLPAAPSTTLTAEEEAKIKSEQDAIQRRRIGRQATILTPELLNNSDTNNPTVEKKTLLGS